MRNAADVRISKELELAPFTEEELRQIQRKIDLLGVILKYGTTLPKSYKDEYLKGEKAFYLENKNGEVVGALSEILDSFLSAYGMNFDAENQVLKFFKGDKEIDFYFSDFYDIGESCVNDVERHTGDRQVGYFPACILQAQKMLYTDSSIDLVKLNLIKARGSIEWIINREKNFEKDRQEIINEAVRTGIEQNKFFGIKIPQKAAGLTQRVYDVARRVYLRFRDPELYIAEKWARELREKNDEKERILKEAIERSREELRLIQEGKGEEERGKDLDIQELFHKGFSSAQKILVEVWGNSLPDNAQDKLVKIAKDIAPKLEDIFSSEQLQTEASKRVEEMQEGQTIFRGSNGVQDEIVVKRRELGRTV